MHMQFNPTLKQTRAERRTDEQTTNGA